MVDEIVTRQELIDAKRDARDLGKAVNEKVIVSPRYGEDFKSLLMISGEAQATIGEWESAIALITQEGGVPALAVSDASGQTQQEINDDQNIINFDTFNTPEKYGADKDAEDNTAALQAWLNSSETLHIRPFRAYKFSGTLNLSVVDQSINGLTFNTYGKSILRYTGTGTAIKSSKNVGYLKLNNFQILSEAKTAGAVFDNGTIGIDLTLGGTIDVNGLFLQGFETLIKSGGTTYYNKFMNCRFGYCRTILMGFASYNLNFMFNRCLQFTDCLTTVSGAGPINMKYNSFEGFNGNIHRSGNDKCEFNFHDNYVEVFDKIALPVNFVRATNQTKGDFFGGNILFQGYYSRCSLRGNKLSLGGAFRLCLFATCAHLESVGNGISLYRENDNLGALFTNNDTYTSVDVNDFYNGDSGEDGGYSRAYGRSSFNNIASFRNKYFYYDCILNENMPLVARSTQPTLLNGWVASSGSGGSVIRVIANSDGSTTVIGSVTGTDKTANAIFNIPDKHRPVEIGNTQTFIVFLSKSQNGVGDNVTLRYYYSGANAGNFELMAEPTSLANIPINFVIPQRI